MYRIILLSALLSLQLAIQAQVVKKLETAPDGIRYRGKAIQVLAWSDSLKENILLLSQVEVYTAKSVDGEENGRADLFAYHYARTDTGWQLVWKLVDGVKDCPVDVTASFITEATAVTDLDKDGLFETTVVYKVACRGDVSPSSMKLIMHEGSTKYALRGMMWVRDSEESKFSLTVSTLDLSQLKGYSGGDEDYQLLYGRYENEKEFKAAPAFLAHARKTWLKFVKGKF